MSHTYDMQDMSIHTRECRQFMYCSGNISHGVPFLLYTTYTCNHYRSAGARRHHCEEDNSEEKKWMHRGSDSYQEGNEISLQMSNSTRRWRVTRFATLLPQTSIHPVDVIFCYQLRSGFERWGWICCELLRSSQSVLEVDIAVIPCTTVG